MDIKYYKLINGSEFIGVASSYNFLKFQTKHRIMLACAEDTAQYVICEKTQKIYHAKWMVPESSEKRGQYETIDVIQITKEEYDLLYDVEEYEIPEPEIIEPEEIPVDPVEQTTLEYVVNQKVKQMSNYCHNAITNGFDIELSGGVMHFSCTTQDQLNLITLANMASSGAMELYPYHADNQPCTYFTAEEITAIVTAMQMLIAKETTYYNSLKSYINGLETKEEVAAVYYGCEIPEEYQSVVYKDLF